MEVRALSYFINYKRYASCIDVLCVCVRVPTC
eukprot:COSAG06_NODE_61598_length_267_cov_0.619048_1_plen_31_part_01